MLVGDCVGMFEAFRLSVVDVYGVAELLELVTSIVVASSGFVCRYVMVE